MISKNDVQNYLNDMMMIEMDMKNKYVELSKKVKDKRYINQFIQLSHEEESHAEMVTSLKELLKTWKEKT